MVEVQARTVLWYLAFFGFAVNYMIRINLNIAIVEMVISKPINLQLTALLSDAVAPNMTTNMNFVIETNDSISSRSLIQLNDQSNSSVNLNKRSWNTISVSDHTSSKANGSQENKNQGFSLHNLEGYKDFSMEKWFLKQINIKFDETGFDWNEYKQGLILGAFFWAHWVTQIPGGILALKYGTKLVFGLSNVVGCWMCFFIPIFSYYDYRALIWWRVLQGLVCGLSWPAMHVLTAHWIPPNERSKFVTAYLGSSIGIAVFYPLFGYVISWTSWEWTFHICGVVGTLWWLGWLYYVYDTPAQHPRISEKEVRFIEKSLGESVQPTKHGQKPESTPWKEILTSRPIWMNVIAQWGGIWGLFTLLTQAPTYFKIIHNWNIQATGILSGLPHLLRMIFAYVYSMFSDYLLRSEKMTRTNVRKLATTFCCTINGFLVLALAYYGHNATAAIVFMTLSTMFHGAVSSGPLASIVDISPNYAGIGLGISGMIGVLPGFISPYIVGALTLNNQTFESWKYVFLIASGMLLGSGLLYTLFSSSELQPWNSRQSYNDDKELQLLQSKREQKHDGEDKVENISAKR